MDEKSRDRRKTASSVVGRVPCLGPFAFVTVSLQKVFVCLFSFAVIVLGEAKARNVGDWLGIIIRSHHAGMCVLASHWIVAYRL